MRCASAFLLAAVARGLRLEAEPPSPVPVPPIVLPKGIQRVWIDVGTASHTDFERNLLDDPRLFLIGVEPTPGFVKSVRAQLSSGAAKERFAIVDRACTDRSGQSLKFFVHPQAECNSLNEADPKANVRGGDCVGTPPTEIKVQSVALKDVFSQLPPDMRVQLLKLDVQGHEWPCIAGTFGELERVDNLFIEVQDTTKTMYKDQVTLGGMDSRLHEKNFIRQYCEVNSGGIRELNCLYTRQGKKPVWITGRPQRGEPVVKLLKPSVNPNFMGVQYIDKFLTSNETGVMVRGMRKLPLKFR
mmetsp:Transcript_899/g.3137  ORF Transcript_899/g.3137 Transcript_899/m.3137 type:complete len:300 (+) Transcript_899:89-988(+)